MFKQYVAFKPKVCEIQIIHFFSDVTLLRVSFVLDILATMLSGQYAYDNQQDTDGHEQSLYRVPLACNNFKPCININYANTNFF